MTACQLPDQYLQWDISTADSIPNIPDLHHAGS